jgi:hypothetical protein
MLSCRDRYILDAVEEFKSLTIKQIGYMFFPKNQHNYYYARNRTKLLENKGFMKSTMFEGQKVFYMNEKSNITLHRKILLDFYSTMIYFGITIEDYKFEYHWMDGKYKSDGMFIVNYSGVRFVIACEVDLTHNTNIRKYEYIYNSGFCQDKFGDFPFVVIINRNGKEYNHDSYTLDYMNYLIYLDYDMKNFNKLLAQLS